MGYRLPGGNVRSPDVSFVAAARIPADRLGFMDAAPDLAVEIISPGDRVRRVHDRVGEYLEAGVRLVWVIDPVRQTAVIYRGTDGVESIDATGALDGLSVLPGFRCPLADLFH
jgi:Uma2 family endonuclease